MIVRGFGFKLETQAITLLRDVLPPLVNERRHRLGTPFKRVELVSPGQTLEYELMEPSVTTPVTPRSQDELEQIGDDNVIRVWGPRRCAVSSQTIDRRTHQVRHVTIIPVERTRFFRGQSHQPLTSATCVLARKVAQIQEVLFNTYDKFEREASFRKKTLQ